MYIYLFYFFLIKISLGVLRQPLPLRFCPRQWMSSKMGSSSQRGSVRRDLYGSRMWFSKYNHLCSHFCILYYFSLSHAETKDNNLVSKYHPNFWIDGKWRCCQQTEKLAAGCHVYDPLGFGSYSLFLFFLISGLIRRWTHYLDVADATADFEHLSVKFLHSF